MKIVFFGTSKFSEIILKHLLLDNNLEVVGIVTRPDSIKKRGKELMPSFVKSYVQNYSKEKHGSEDHIPIFTPQNLKNDEIIDMLTNLKADIFCVASYGAILPMQILDIPKCGCINVHASLLPKWRGAAPIERSILNGEDYQGISIMKMDEGLDTGDFCAQETICTAGINAEEIIKELGEAGGRLLTSCLPEIYSNNIKWIQQDEMQATYAKKIEKGELNILRKDTCKQSFLKILASSDSHPCKCIIDGKNVRIVSAQFLDKMSRDDLHKYDLVFHNKELYMCFDDGYLKLLQIKQDGKKQLDAISFANGINNIRENKAKWQCL